MADRVAPAGAPRKTRRPSGPPKGAAAVSQILAGLHEFYPSADCELKWGTPMELLIATILSAQTTDVRVNMVTPALFAKYPRPEDYLAAPDTELEEAVRSTGFFRSKTRHIKGACETIIRDFGGQVPRTMDEMLTIPGAARKTSNVVLGVAFGIAAGVVVDTHVRRLSQRLGWTVHTDPQKIELDLMRLLPEQEWIYIAHALIWHGRRICTARKPNCPACPIEEWCEKRGVVARSDKPDRTD